jgi:uncharacterized membrane protein
MTMAAALYLLESDFKNAGGREGGVLLASFFWGAFGMLIGACLAYFLLQVSAKTKARIVMPYVD